MTTYEACRSDLLVFTASRSTSEIEAALSRITDRPLDQHLMLASDAGEAMRLIHRHQPRLLLICVERAKLEQSARLIGAVHQRRPQLPLIAIALNHDPEIERGVRSAGASFYFGLDNDADEQLLRGALRELGSAPAVARSGLSPPKARGRPPARRRSRASR